MKQAELLQIVIDEFDKTLGCLGDVSEKTTFGEWKCDSMDRATLLYQIEGKTKSLESSEENYLLNKMTDDCTLKQFADEVYSLIK